MPIIKSAKKQMRSSARKRKMNLSRRKVVKTSLRVAHEQPTVESLKVAQKALDKAAGKNTIHRNKAARLKSRLSRKLKSA